MKIVPITIVAFLLLTTTALAVDIPEVPQEKVDEGVDLFSGFLHNGENMMNGIASILDITAGMLAYVLFLLLCFLQLFSKQLSKFVMIFGVILLGAVVVGLI